MIEKASVLLLKRIRSPENLAYRGKLRHVLWKGFTHFLRKQ